MTLVSVITAAFNAGSYLKPAIDSILAQSHQQLELIVVDDGSTDGSVEQLAKKYTDARIKWLRQDNAGKAVALNLALKHARGDFYLLQDSDDYSHPWRVELLLQAMQNNPDVAAVFSGHELILGGHHMAPTFRTRSVEDCRRDIDRMAMPGHDPTAMYRMSLVRGIEYEPSLLLGQGYDYILRVGEPHPMMVLGECLYSYRIHWNSITRSDPERRQRFVGEVIRRACERRGTSFAEWQRSCKRRWRSTASTRDNGMAGHFVKSVQDQLDIRRRVDAIQTGLQCARLHPLDPQYLKALICAISPVRLGSRRAPC